MLSLLQFAVGNSKPSLDEGDLPLLLVLLLSESGIQRLAAESTWSRPASWASWSRPLLSPLLVEEMFGLIRQLRSTGLAVLLVEQNVGQSLEVADRAYVMENGSIRFTGLPDELLRSDELRRAYLGL